MNVCASYKLLKESLRAFDISAIVISSMYARPKHYEVCDRKIWATNNAFSSMNERAKNESLAKPWAAVAVARVVVSYGRDRDRGGREGGLCARACDRHDGYARNMSSTDARIISSTDQLHY